MKVALYYELNSVKIDWNLPFLPRAGEYISVAELISDRQNKVCAIDRVLHGL